MRSSRWRGTWKRRRTVAARRRRTWAAAFSDCTSIAGHVVEFAKVIGHVVKAEEPLVTTHDLSQPLVVGFVTERDLPHVRVGQAARVRLVGEPDRVRTGKVVRGGRVFAADQTLLV